MSVHPDQATTLEEQTQAESKIWVKINEAELSQWETKDYGDLLGGTRGREEGVKCLQISTTVNRRISKPTRM
jgi:hypothetical protein